MHQLVAVVGYFVILGLGVALSRDRKAIRPRVIVWGCWRSGCWRCSS